MQAGLPILLRHGPLQPGLGELIDASEEKDRRERESFQEKGGQPAPAICHWEPDGDRDSPEHRRRGGGPVVPPQKVKQHAGTYKPRGRRSPPSAPSPIQQTTKAGKKLIAEHRDGRSRSLPTVTYIQMQPRVSIPGTALQSWRTSPEQGEQECLWHPAKQQSMEDLVSQVQLSSC